MSGRLLPCRRVSLLALAGALVVLSVDGCFAQSSTDVFDRARQAVAAQDLEHARDLFLEVVRLDPGHGEAYFYLAQISARLGSEAQTIDYYLKATELLPSVSRVWQFYGLWLLDRGYFGEAVRVFSRLVELVPSSAGFCGRLGEAMYSDGEPAAAMRQLEDCLQMSGVGPHEYYVAGLSARMVRGSRSATDYFKRVLELEPGHAEARYQLGHILLQEGKPEAALPYLEDLPSDHQPGRYSLAVALFQSGQLEAALGVFESLLRTNPDHVRAHYQLGLLYRTQGELEKSEQVLARFRELEAAERDSRKTSVKKEIVHRP